MSYPKKINCPWGHPYFGDNLYIHPKGGHRMCRACNRRRVRNYQQTDKFKATKKRYYARPEVMERQRRYEARPYVKLRRGIYLERPEVIERRRKYRVSERSRLKRILKDRRYRKQVRLEKKKLKQMERIEAIQTLICYSSKCRGSIQDHTRLVGDKYECGGCGRPRTISSRVMSNADRMSLNRSPK